MLQLQNVKFYLVNKLLFVGFAGLYATTALCALPPYYQTSKEIKTILDNRAVAHILGSGGVIEVIQKTEDGYLIKTNQCRLQVQVVYKEQQRLGPHEFTIAVGQNNCPSWSPPEPF